MNNEKTVLVCVTPQESSKILVDAGRGIADKNGSKLQVISVLPLNPNDSKKQIAVCENIYQFTTEANGEMAVYFSDEPILTIAAHITKEKPSDLVVGFPGEKSNGFISIIRSLFPTLPISMVDGKKIYNMLPQEACSGARK